MTEAERLAEHLEGIAEVYPIATGNRAAITKSADLLRQQSARIAALEEAMRFYARENCWRSSGVYMSGKSQASQAELDRGNKARLALGKGSE